MITETLTLAKLVEMAGKFVVWVRKQRTRPAETVAGRFIRLFESHDVHRNQIPRFFGRGLTLRDMEDESSLLDKLDEQMLEAVCDLFAVRREWLEGADGLLNPPFSQSDINLHELQFTKHMLDCLEVGGVGIAIMPMSCAITPNPLKAEILKHHTLEAVMSMPDQLFYPVGTITCIMVLRAHIPHTVSNIKTWFGFWKWDGYELVRHRGRIDPEHKWDQIRDSWVEMFRNREVHPGKSVLKHVTAEDEWCAEAYLETDYAHLGRATYELTVKRFLLSQLLNEAIEDGDESTGKDD